MPDQIVALMAKWPELGKVKTRLGNSLGDKAALTVYCKLLENSLRQCRPNGTDSYILGAFVNPPEKLHDFEDAYPGQSFYIQQTGTNLGDKMRSAFLELFDNFAAKTVILIGADIPNLSRQQINEAFELLKDNDITLGPTADGGYYLIGMRGCLFEIFSEVKWGTSSVFEQTTNLIEENSLSLSLLSPLHDLDVEDDLNLFPEFTP